MHTGFKDYNKFIGDLEKALNDEAGAIEFYTKLMEMTKHKKYKEYIGEARDDEKRHLRLFTNLYMRLTGRRPVITPGSKFKGSFIEGIQRAFDDEQEAYILYRDMFLNAMIPEVRDIVFIPFTDENEHAQKFTWIYADLNKDHSS